MNLSVDESILTGESVPVQKFTAPIEGEATVADMGNMVHMGCPLVNSKGLAVVIPHGMNTEIGRITAQVQEVELSAHPPAAECGQAGALCRHSGARNHCPPDWHRTGEGVWIRGHLHFRYSGGGVCHSGRSARHGDRGSGPGDEANGAPECPHQETPCSGNHGRRHGHLF